MRVLKIKWTLCWGENSKFEKIKKYEKKEMKKKYWNYYYALDSKYSLLPKKEQKMVF